MRKVIRKAIVAAVAALGISEVVISTSPAAAAFRFEAAEAFTTADLAAASAGAVTDTAARATPAMAIRPRRPNGSALWRMTS